MFRGRNSAQLGKQISPASRDRNLKKKTQKWDI